MARLGEESSRFLPTISVERNVPEAATLSSQLRTAIFGRVNFSLCALRDVSICDFGDGHFERHDTNIRNMEANEPCATDRIPASGLTNPFSLGWHSKPNWVTVRWMLIFPTKLLQKVN